MTARRVWVIRHGDRFDFDVGAAEWEKVAQAINDPCLSDLGRIQAQETGAAIFSRDKKISRVISSPFLRCIETSNPIAGHAGCKICLDDSLFEVVLTNEIHPSPGSRSLYFPRIDLEYVSEPRPQADEAFPSAAMARYAAAALRLVNKFPDEHIVICSHAAGVSAIVACLTGVKVRELPAVAPAALWCLDRVDAASASAHPSYTLVKGLEGSVDHFSLPLGKTLPWPRESDGNDTWGLAWIEVGDKAPWLL